MTAAASRLISRHAMPRGGTCAPVLATDYFVDADPYLGKRGLEVRRALDRCFDDEMAEASHNASLVDWWWFDAGRSPRSVRSVVEGEPSLEAAQRSDPKGLRLMLEVALVQSVFVKSTFVQLMLGLELELGTPALV